MSKFASVHDFALNECILYNGTKCNKNRCNENECPLLNNYECDEYELE